MNIHEYQAKAILRKFGVPVPDGHVCYNGASAREWAKRLGEGPWVVKAQIHAASGLNIVAADGMADATKKIVQAVAAYIAGMTAPPGKRMGHAGAIISGGKGTVSEKVSVLESCGISVAASPAEMAQALLKIYKP